MADRPILFSAPMVRALSDGRKTQTRRMLSIGGHKEFSEFGPSDTPGYDWHFRRADACWCDFRHSELLARLRWHAGDRLWVKETFFPRPGLPERLARPRYRAEEDRPEWRGLWRPSIFMPRWASRLTLTVTDVRVQRLQDISDEDAVAEGLIKIPSTVHMSRWGADDGKPETHRYNPGNAYAVLWNSINGEGSWAANPWVVAVSFSVERRNIDG